MTQREAIERTYRDRFQAERKKNLLEEETGITRQEYVPLPGTYPCGLSHGAGRGWRTSDHVGETQEAYTLFHAPELALLPGDRIKISTEAGQELSCVAGKSFRYVTHGETVLTARTRADQEPEGGRE